MITAEGFKLYTVFHKKMKRYLIAHNFGKCLPIFKFFFTIRLGSKCVTK